MNPTARNLFASNENSGKNLIPSSAINNNMTSSLHRLTAKNKNNSEEINNELLKHF